jgi:serine/threonine protein phosphatase 1
MIASMRRLLPIDRTDGDWPEFDSASPAVTGLSRIYAIGDIHGYDDLLEAMQQAIAADLESRPSGQALIIYLGDIIDRGPNSLGVVDMIIDHRANPPANAQVMCLRGNHDEWLIDFIDDAGVISPWALKGGLETLASYGLSKDEVLAAVADPDRAEPLRQQFLAGLPERHKDFMLSLPFSHSDGDYFFAHAGIDPDRPLADQRREDLTWIRDKFLLSRKNFSKVVVHGHSHRDAVESLPNRINVDTGAYVQQVLSCVILEGQDRYVLQVGDIMQPEN